MVSADGGGVVHVISAAPPDNSLWQVGIHIKLIGGVYVYAVYVNGALAGTYTRTATVLLWPPSPGSGRIREPLRLGQASSTVPSAMP
jgi:hypothetical protein